MAAEPSTRRHQFESIHPFYDGNGRTGRIINVLYLVKEGMLEVPVLYLSRHIMRTKGDYYRLLQAVREYDLNVSRPTATKYLKALTEGGFLEKRKVGRSNFYINVALNAILTGAAMQAATSQDG